MYLSLGSRFVLFYHLFRPLILVCLAVTGIVLAITYGLKYCKKVKNVQRTLVVKHGQ